jgi:hypothetical protein
MKMANEAKNENRRCCAAPGASRNDSYADWDMLMVPDGDVADLLPSILLNSSARAIKEI